MLNQPKSYTKALIFLILTIVLLIPYSIGAQVWDSGYRSDKSLQRNNVTDSHLIIGRDTVTGSVLVIDTSTTTAPTTYSLEGYSYQSLVTITNNCSYDQNIRFLIENFPFSSLVSGGYIQADGDDIALTYEGATEERLTAMTGTDGDNLMLNYYNLPAHSSLTGHLYMGNPTKSRDQWWVGDADDVITIADHASLDISGTLTITANINLPKDPTSGTPQAIVQKANAYELMLDNTPQLTFRVYIGGTPSEVSRTLVDNIDIPIICTYTGTSVQISTGSGTDVTACTGNIDTNANDVSIVQADLLIDDLIILNDTSQVAYFDFEPEDCTDTTIDDKSVFGNDATYVLSGTPTCISVAYGAVDFTGDTLSLSPSDYPASIVDNTSPLFVPEPDNPPRGNRNAFQGIVDALSDTTAIFGEGNRINEHIIAMVIYLGVMITVWITLSKYVRDRLIMGIATIAVTAAAVVLSGGLIPWAILILHMIVVIWMVVSERSQSI